jgi:hypothetical protein
MRSRDFCLSERGAVATRSQLGSVNRNPAQNAGQKRMPKVFTRIPKTGLLAFSVVLVGAILPGCSQSGTNRPAGDSATAQPSASPVPRTGFDRDLQFIRNGQFAHVWVFSRPDGKPLDKDDAAYLRANAPQVVDWVTTDDKKHAIAGTNFDLEQGNLPKLRQRFVVEDYTGK